MGVFDVEITLRNWQESQQAGAESARDVVCQATVDSGAVELALPADIVEGLRLVPLGTIGVRTADGARHDYRVMGIVEIEVQGRAWQGQAVELPRGAKPLLGAIPLDAMDWHISPRERKLVPSPQSPDEPEVWLLGL